MIISLYCNAEQYERSLFKPSNNLITARFDGKFKVDFSIKKIVAL
jgi:hypothetical protein